jgi:hypothetical protein
MKHRHLDCKARLLTGSVTVWSLQDDLWAGGMTPEHHERLMQFMADQTASIQHTSEEARANIEAQREELLATAREHRHEPKVG